MTSSDPDCKETPSQTAGPYVHIGLAPDRAGLGNQMPGLGAMEEASDQGTPITVTGQVFDGDGATVNDVLIEVWHADANGIYHVTPGARAGWGRVIPDFTTGRFTFGTIKPGPVKTSPGVVMAPHLNLWLVARGINIGLQTRMYFPEDEELFVTDPVLKQISEDARRATLVSRKQADAYHFNIALQGTGETVFFDV